MSFSVGEEKSHFDKRCVNLKEKNKGTVQWIKNKRLQKTKGRGYTVYIVMIN